MNRILLLLATMAIVVTEGLGQSDTYNFRSTDGATLIAYNGIQVTRIDSKRNKYLFLRGVRAKFLKTNVTISADHAVAYSNTEGGKIELTTLTAFQHVELIQVGYGASAGQKSVMNCEKLEFINGRIKSSAKSPGTVFLTESNSEKKETIHAKGGSGLAEFSGGVESKEMRLEKATLFNPVDLRVVQAAQRGSKPENAHITCQQLVYVPKGTGGEFDLTGKVHMTSSEGVTDLKRETVFLNEKLEFNDFSGSSDH